MYNRCTELNVLGMYTVPPAIRKKKCSNRVDKLDFGPCVEEYILYFIVLGDRRLGIKPDRDRPDTGDRPLLNDSKLASRYIHLIYIHGDHSSISQSQERGKSALPRDKLLIYQKIPK
jgi:hypothetical protein